MLKLIKFQHSPFFMHAKDRLPVLCLFALSPLVRAPQKVTVPFKSENYLPSRRFIIS